MININITKALAQLNQEPPESIIKEHKGVLYVPIEYIEMTLDKIFTPFGWSSDIVSETRVLNEWVVSVQLRIHVNGFTLTRPGTGSMPIQQKKDTSISQFEDAKFSNSMQKSAPSALSHAMSNAAEKLGRCFGVNLKRAKGKKYNIYADAASLEDNLESLEAAWNNLPPEKRRDQSIIMAYNRRKKQLNEQSNNK